MNRRPDVREAPLPPQQAEQVRALLKRILSSQPFRGSRRCQSLLGHLTEQTLTGDTHALKERTIGIDVFGREPDYDTARDPVVRATAAEVRKKLAQYYQDYTHEGEGQIELLPGSYVVEFHLNGTEPPPPVKPRLKRHGLMIACAAAAILFVVAAILVLEHRRRPALDQLWAPLLDSPGPVLLCVGQPIVYNLRSTYAQDRIQGIVGAPAAREPRPPDTISRKDLLILGDRYVDLGDAVCLAHLASHIERYGKLCRIRGERSTSFADLSDGASVLIGAFNNQWTLHAADQLRYTFFKDSVNEIDMVRDRQHPENTDWKLTRAWPDWDGPTDYAIISRFFDSRTNRPVIIAAGITHHGTMAAGNFLVDPDHFADASAKLAPGWQKKNLQVVLSVPVVKGVAGRPRVIATHVW